MLLNAQNALLFRTNTVSKISPRVSRISHINPKHTPDVGTSLSKSVMVSDRRNSNFSEFLYVSDHTHSPLQSPRDSRESSMSPTEHHGNLIDQLDINQIPDFPPINTNFERFASCPNSVQITPCNLNSSNPKNKPRTPDIPTKGFFEEEDLTSHPLRYSSVAPEPFESMPDMLL